MSLEPSEIRGGCLCGAVRFSSPGPLAGNSACHCGQCRRWSGHYWASVNVPVASLAVQGPVRWFQSSDAARRGFCETCGSALFWQQTDPAADKIGVALGALDTPTGLRLERHIFVADKGDYYDIADGLPQETRP